MNIAIATVIAVVLTIGSNCAESAEKEPNMQEVCGSYAEMARIVMTERQRGVPMQEMMKRADGREPHQKMIVQAYGISKKSTQKYQKKDIARFADEWYLDCARYFETR